MLRSLGGLELGAELAALLRDGGEPEREIVAGFLKLRAVREAQAAQAAFLSEVTKTEEQQGRGWCKASLAFAFRGYGIGIELGPLP